MALTIDDFLASNVQAFAFTATIEPASDGQSVKVTPWVEGECRCDAALVIPKSAIREVEPTKNIHVCCGKRLVVATVIFSDEGRALPGIFDQLLERRLGADRDETFARQRRYRADNDEGCTEQCADELQWCNENCGTSFPCYTCRHEFWACRRRCRK